MLPPPHSCRQPNPGENSLTSEDPPVREPIDFLPPRVPAARVVCFFLLIAPVLFTGMGGVRRGRSIETLPHSLVSSFMAAHLSDSETPRGTSASSL